MTAALRGTAWRVAPTAPRAKWMVALALLAANASAADDNALRVQLAQKIRLAAGLIADSPAAQRIAASADPQANAHLDESRVHQALARDLLERGDLAGAQQAVDDALRHIGMARRLAPDAAARQAAARQRHEQLLGSIERLMAAWQARAAAQAADGDGAQDMTAAIGLLGNARELGRVGRYEEANAQLALAERHVLSGMNRLLKSATLDYTARFDDPAAEFQHELSRHAGLADLVPMAVDQLGPGATALALIERYGETARALRAQALARFQSGAVAQALNDIRNASLYLDRALSAAGLVAAPTAGSAP